MDKRDERSFARVASVEVGVVLSLPGRREPKEGELISLSSPILAFLFLTKDSPRPDTISLPSNPVNLDSFSVELLLDDLDEETGAKSRCKRGDEK